MSKEVGKSPDKKQSPGPGNLEDWLQLPDDSGDNISMPPGSPKQFLEEEDKLTFVNEIPSEPETEHDSDPLPCDQIDTPEGETLHLPLKGIVAPDSGPPDESPLECEPLPEKVEDSEYENTFEIPEPAEISDREQDSDEPADDADPVDDLERNLAIEFRDTLTSGNAMALPIAIILCLLSILGWLHGPLLEFFNMEPLIDPTRLYVITASAILSLAGLHLFIYWLVHRISNAVKSSE